MGDLIGYPTESAKCCAEPKPRELTDTEKAIYLKLVALANAGKIIWDARNVGVWGQYRVYVYDGTIQIALCGKDGSELHNVAYFGIRGDQVAGDLAAIASEQYEAAKEQRAQEFLAI